MFCNRAQAFELAVMVKRGLLDAGIVNFKSLTSSSYLSCKRPFDVLEKLFRYSWETVLAENVSVCRSCYLTMIWT